MATCGSIFSSTTTQSIKIIGGDFVAIEGSNAVEKLLTSDLRIPYKQLLKSRIILKAGQVNYLLNHLGLGDNATFIIIKAVYNSASVNEEDNYLQWSFYSDLTKVYNMDQLMVLTGNSTNRLPQIYLTNPNTKYAVTLDVMVANIDDTYNYFTDSINQSGTSFVGLEYTDIHSHVVGESIVINDKSSSPKPLIYLTIANINSIERSGKILILDDSSRGSIFLQFLTEFDSAQANSLLNYVIQNPNIDIDLLSPIEDDESPVIYFKSKVGNTGNFISFMGQTSGVPYNTTFGNTFSTSISLSGFGTSSVINKDLLQGLLFSSIIDNRDGTMSMLKTSMILSGTSGTASQITSTGTYSLTFDFSDIALNYIDGVIVNLNITS